MRIYYYYILFFVITTTSYAQKYGNIWYFTDKAGIDFNSCTPSVLTNGQNTSGGGEGSAAICDTSGQFLFYTNSDIVWNKQHIPMPNGNLVSSNGTLSQVLIIPKPLSQNMYYVITTQIQGQAPLNLQYHTVDMSLNGGMGDVVNKNNTLTTDTITEQVAATYHGNGIDIWVITHEYGNNKFLCYLVTSAGINPSPIISNIGPAIIPCSSGMNARGEIKFSPDGKKLAINNNGIGNNPNSDYLCLFDFNNGTGIVSNPINLPYERGGFGLSFSSDNTKLYAATWKSFSFTAADSNKIFQFDISSNDSLTISNSKAILYTTPLTNGSPFGSLKLGPDGKIYVAISNSTYAGVINSPNQPGVLCNYVNNGFYLGGNLLGIGLNNYIEYKTYCGDVGVYESIKSNIPQLGEARPNPNNGKAEIDYYIPASVSNAKMIFTDMLGRVINETKLVTGYGTISVDTQDLTSGNYIFSLVVDGKVFETKKMTRNK